MRFALSILALFVLAAPALAQQTIVPAKDGVVQLGPANSQIKFVGIHEGDKPDPRQGGFAKFKGLAGLDQSGALQSVAFDIETASLWSEIPKLTNHLKSPDFFDVRQHPTAAFRSTAIRPTDQPGVFMIQGDFTLLGVTKEVTMPATINGSSNGLTLISQFKLDRTKFGMNYGQGKVHKDVAITVVIGEATADS